MLRILFASLLAVLAACGGSSSSLPSPATPLSVETAELPYRLLRAKTGRELGADEFYAELRGAQAVCVGESHTDVHHHWAQLEVLQHLTARDRDFATGMEMFQRPFQGVLDDFVEGRITEEEMLSRTDWKRRWSYDWSYYAPMVRLTASRGGSLVALNISKELKEKWKASGTEGLDESERAKIPELNLEDDEHRRWFRVLMESMDEGHGSEDNGGHALLGDPDDDELPHPEASEPHAGAPVPDGAHPHETHPGHGEAAKAGEGSAEPEAEPDFIDKIYPVQVLWDETMADTASKWVQAEAGRQIVILAGHGHCHESAIIRRMKRRGVGKVVSVRPVVETGHGEVADLLTAPENDYLFVMDKPAPSDP